MHQNTIYTKALDVLHQGTTPKGFLASPQNVDNYQRVWARDAVITGIGCLFSDEKTLINGFKNSLDLLAKHQSKFGQIPSNISVKNQHVSYGSLAGRVDATSWYAIGACAYILTQNDAKFALQHQKNIEKALELLQIYEFNNRGLTYIPLSGNWADEYILDGYVLYDQLLKLWAIKLYQKAFEKDLSGTIQKLEKLIIQNYKAENLPQESYHPSLYQKDLPSLPYWAAGFNPSRYFHYFDAFANSLAILLLNHPFNQTVTKHLLTLLNQHFLVPAHLPVITPKTEDWKLLEKNHSYEFKNHPYTYHNGGLWPMVNGWVGWALHKQRRYEAVNQMTEKIHALNAKNEHAFYEHFHAQTKQPLGTKHQLWSASASVLMHHLNQKNTQHLITQILFHHE